MTGKEFETTFCNELKSHGYWALNIPRDRRGAQPFDIIAVRDNDVVAVDCKVCSSKTFPLARIEDNQWLAFKAISSKTCTAKVGIVAFCESTQKQYFIPYYILEQVTDKSVKLTDEHYERLWEEILS